MWREGQNREREREPWSASHYNSSLKYDINERCCYGCWRADRDERKGQFGAYGIINGTHTLHVVVTLLHLFLICIWNV